MYQRQLRVLYLPILFYPDTWNGIMEHMLHLINDLNREQYEPFVAVRPDEGDQTRALVDRTGATPCLLSEARTAAEIRDLCRSKMINIVHIQTPVTGGVPRMAFGVRLGGASLTLVTYQLVQPSPLRRRSRLINRAVHRFLIHHTIAVSGGVADSLVVNTGLRSRRIQIIHNTVDPYTGDSSPLPVPRSPNEVWIGYFGRLAQEKGLPCLIDALSLLRTRCPHAHTILVGDGYERAALEEQARRLGLGDRIVFAGHRDDTRALMREVDIVVLPSLIEGFSLTILEAMDAARPLVATRIPGTVEAVEDGVTGLLVPPANSQALADTLSVLVEDPARRAAMGNAGRQRFLKNFPTRQMVEPVYRMYDEQLRLLAHSVS
ncbi:MAG: glycosyltransferase family 4 protein [Chloroflexota bacterium]